MKFFEHFVICWMRNIICIKTIVILIPPPPKTRYFAQGFHSPKTSRESVGLTKLLLPELNLREKDRPSDIEQQTPFGDRKWSNTLLQMRRVGYNYLITHIKLDNKFPGNCRKLRLVHFCLYVSPSNFRMHPLVTPPPLNWGSVLLYLLSPNGGCCLISDDFTCS